MNRSKIKIYTLLVIIFMFVVACSKTETFAINKNNLDQLTVDTYMPLEIPPLYYLSSQEIADERRFIRQNQESVRNVMTGRIARDTNNKVITSNSSNNFTKADLELLKLTKASESYNNIKSKIDEELSGVVTLDDGTILKINNNKTQEALPESLNEYKRLNKK